MVAVLSLVSAAFYFAFSGSFRAAAASWSYHRFLYGELAARHTPGSPAPTGAFDGQGFFILSVFIASCIAVGLAGTRFLGRRERRAPVLVMTSLTAAVVPALVIALGGWPDGRGFLSSSILIGINVAIAVALHLTASRLRDYRMAKEPDGPVPPAEGLGGWGWAFLGLAVLLGACVFVNGYSGIKGSDSLAYHLPLAARWLQKSRLVTGPEAAVNLFYPGNFELLVRWMLVPRADRFAFLPAFFSSVGCIYALFLISREAGQPKRIAVVSALSALSLPLVPYLGGTVYSDTFAAMALLMAVFFLLRWANTGYSSSALTVLVGLSLGLALGTKYSAAPATLVIVLTFMWLLFKNGTRRNAFGVELLDTRRFLSQMLILSAALLVCSGFWYMRNLVEHGNPFFPVAGIGLPGLAMRALIPIKAELATPGWSWLAFPWTESGYRQEFEDGVGPTFPAVALLGLLVVPFLKGPDRSAARLVCWMTLAVAVLWLLTGNITPRYGLFPLLLAFVFVGELWMRFGSGLLKVVTLASYCASAVVVSEMLIGGAVYAAIVPPGRLGVPTEIDRLPPARVLNGLGGPAAYYAMGRDYRHEVITPYRAAEPGDILRFDAQYVLLEKAQVDAFSTAAKLSYVATGQTRSGEITTLWKVQP